jgi:hypothetical protein
MKTKTIEFGIGSHVSGAAEQLVSEAKKISGKVRGDFNGITLTATSTSSTEDILAFYDAESNRRAEAYRNSPEGKKAAREAEEFRQRADAARAEGILPFSLKDPEGWKQSVEKNTDGYGSCVMRYAARWANLMEKKMSEGAKLEDIAAKASHEADVEGITGFMYGCAVTILSQVWEHGEHLRRWHNLDTQLGNEGEKANESGGVLNPAVLSLG